MDGEPSQYSSVPMPSLWFVWKTVAIGKNRHPCHAKNKSQQREYREVKDMSSYFPFQKVDGWWMVYVEPLLDYCVHRVQLLHYLTYTDTLRYQFHQLTHLGTAILLWYFRELFCVTTVSKYISIYLGAIIDGWYFLPEKAGMCSDHRQSFYSKVSHILQWQNFDSCISRLLNLSFFSPYFMVAAHGFILLKPGWVVSLIYVSSL